MVVHELGHVLLCRLSGVAIRRVVLFQIGNPAGFVAHAAPRLLRQALAISSGPLLVNSLLALVLFGGSARLLAARPDPWWPVGAGLGLWLGLSCSLEAWPSRGDAQALRRSAVANLRQLQPLGLPALLLAWLLLAIDASRRVGGHWLYAAMLAASALQLAAP